MEFDEIKKKLNLSDETAKKVKEMENEDLTGLLDLFTKVDNIGEAMKDSQVIVDETIKSLEEKIKTSQAKFGDRIAFTMAAATGLTLATNLLDNTFNNLYTIGSFDEEPNSKLLKNLCNDLNELFNKYDIFLTVVNMK